VLGIVRKDNLDRDEGGSGDDETWLTLQY